MSLNEISNAIKIIENLFSDDGKFYEYNIHIFQQFFKAKNISYEIIPPTKDEPNIYKLFYWDQKDFGAQKSIVIYRDVEDPLDI